MHSTLQIQLDLSREDRWVHQSAPKRPLRELLVQAFELRYGVGPSRPPVDLQLDAELLSGDVDLPQELNNPETLLKPTPFLMNLAAKEFKGAKAKYYSRRDAFYNSAKVHMDHCIDAVEPQLRKAIAEKNTTAFWRVFWETIESATLAFTADAHECHDVKSYSGRGLSPVKLTKQSTPKVNQTRDGIAMHSPSWLAAIQHQANRRKFLADNLAILGKGKISDAGKADVQIEVEAFKSKVVQFLEWQCRNHEQMTLPDRMGSSADASPPHPALTVIRWDSLNLKTKLQDPQASFFAGHFALKRELKKYELFIGTWQRHFAHQQQSKERLRNLQHRLGAMCSVLKGTSAAPITRIKVESNGKSNHSAITTDPEAIDKQLQSIWGKIHAGNFGSFSQADAGRAFLDKYGQYMVSQPAFSVPKLTADHLKQAIEYIPDNAPGLDGVHEGDLAVLSDHALQWLATLLNTIEEGAPWHGLTKL